MGVLPVIIQILVGCFHYQQSSYWGTFILRNPHNPIISHYITIILHNNGKSPFFSWVIPIFSSHFSGSFTLRPALRRRWCCRPTRPAAARGHRRSAVLRSGWPSWPTAWWWHHNGMWMLLIFTGWWFEPLWKIWKSIGMIIPNIWDNKKCSKPPTSSMGCLIWAV